MTTKKEPFNLAAATAKQIKKYAKDNYDDLSLSLSMSTDTMRIRIYDYCVENNLEQPTAELATASNKKVKGKKVTINIATAEGKNGDQPVFIGVQGVGYTIPRGIDVAVPETVVEVLKNAVQDIITQDEDGELLHRHVLTYPFSVLSVAL